MINEHRMNCSHKDNRNGLCQMFNGGECEIRSVAGHNVHEKKCGRVQQGGTGILLYGYLIDQYNFESSGKDDTGLGRWVSMLLQGADRIRTRMVCGYMSQHKEGNKVYLSAAEEIFHHERKGSHLPKDTL